MAKIICKFNKSKITALLLCLLTASLLLFAQSCGGTARQNGKATSDQAEGGEDEDAVGPDGGEAGEEDGGGESGGPQNSDGGGVDAGADAPDDAYATQPARSYPPEVQSQLAKFQEIASELPMDDVPSAATLLKAYRELAFEDPVNDALFFAYEENMQFLCEGMNDAYGEAPPDEETVGDALENGFLYIPDETYSPYFILRADFLNDTFKDTVSDQVKVYLALSARHYGYHADHDLIENDTLLVTLDQLAEMIVDWENYILSFPDALNRSDIEGKLDNYLKIYVGSIQIENSGLYSLAGTDENGEPLYKLMDEPRQSYMKFIENYRDAAACQYISELYQIYKNNNFLYSVEVEDFFRRNGLAYDLD